jgi:pimeloyl-ACP methyl ester carboxylesterase
MIEHMLRGEGPALLVRRQRHNGPPVLYVHGATFPSALSAAYRFNGRSWMDDWNAHGFDAWAFDFAGYGGSDRYEEMRGECAGAPLGRAPQAAGQIARVVKHIADVTQFPLRIVAHSWGTIPAALFAMHEPQRVERLCLFGPVLQRSGAADAPIDQRWRLVTVAQQLARFISDVPAGHPPVLIEPELHAWGPAYLASDREAEMRAPPAVRIPNGPAADIADAWSGHLPWQPRALHCPVLCVRGEWDSVTNDADAAWLKTQLPSCRDVKIAKGTHLMHLEHAREDLFAAVREFLCEAPQ